MDQDPLPHSNFWAKLGRLFSHDNEETLEQAIIEAREEGEVEPEEESMLLGILRFNDLQVHDTMIPRLDIDCVSETASLQDVANIIIETGHSRIPVYRETRDNMVGIIHAKDLLRAMLEEGNDKPPLKSVMREPFFVPETKSIRSLLEEFRSRKQHIAIALDEYGGTSGLITIEDVIEEIVGDIEDEHDAPREADIRKISETAYELTGRAWLEDLQEIGIDLESDEVDTIGGYLSLQAGHVPSIGESWQFGDWKFTVKDSDQKLIRRLLMEKTESAKDNAENGS